MIHFVSCSFSSQNALICIWSQQEEEKGKKKGKKEKKDKKDKKDKKGGKKGKKGKGDEVGQVDSSVAYQHTVITLSMRSMNL